MSTKLQSTGAGPAPGDGAGEGCKSGQCGQSAGQPCPNLYSLYSTPSGWVIPGQMPDHVASQPYCVTHALHSAAVGAQLEMEHTSRGAIDEPGDGAGEGSESGIGEGEADGVGVQVMTVGTPKLAAWKSSPDSSGYVPTSSVATSPDSASTPLIEFHVEREQSASA